MSRFTSRQTGLLLAVGTAVISGLAIFLNGYAVRAWADVADATTYTTLKNLLAALVIGLIAGTLSWRRANDRPTRPTSGRQWLGLGVVAVIGGSVPFVLFFEGLARATSTQAAFIHKTLFVWVAVLAFSFLKERIGWPHVAALALLAIGQVTLAGGAGDVAVGSGELMIGAATLLWAAEVVLAKRLMGALPSATVALARMVGGSVLLVGYVLVRGVGVDWAQVTAVHVGWIGVGSLFLAGYVAAWFAALSRAPAVDVTAVLVGGAVITAVLQAAVRGVVLPSPVGLALLVGGAVVMVVTSWRREPLGSGT